MPGGETERRRGGEPSQGAGHALGAVVCNLLEQTTQERLAMVDPPLEP
jgi:hypothetical protein